MKMRGENDDGQKEEIWSGQESRKADKKVNALYQTFAVFLIFSLTIIVVVLIGSVVVDNQMSKVNALCSQQEGAYAICTLGYTNLTVDCGKCINSICSDIVVTWHNCTIITYW